MKHTHKTRQFVIQASIVLLFIFGVIVAFTAYIAEQAMEGSFLMEDFLLALIFMSTIQIIVLLSILFVMERIIEIMEEKL